MTLRQALLFGALFLAFFVGLATPTAVPRFQAALAGYQVIAGSFGYPNPLPAREISSEEVSTPTRADIYQPISGCPCPGVLLVLGVNPLPPDDPQVVRLAEDLARAGYVTVVPTIEDLSDGKVTMGAVSDLARWLGTLRGDPSTGGRRIGFVSLSVGASLSLIASVTSSSPADFLFWFGGYGNARSMLTTIFCEQGSVNGHLVPWRPSTTALLIAQQQIADPSTGLVNGRCDLIAIADDEASLLDTLSPERYVDRISPETHLYLLHDRGDSFIHYAETRRFRAALPASLDVTHLETDVFAHVTPSGDISPGAIVDVARLILLITAFVEETRG